MTQQEKNQKAKLKILEGFEMEWHQMWQERDWTDLISIFRLYGGRCVQCGGYITAPNLKFFGFDVDKVKCWNCQEGNLKTSNLPVEDR